MDIIEGIVERVTFYSAETGYSVLRLRPTPARTGMGVSRDGLITVVGNLPEANAGESLRVSGLWQMHPQHGHQLQAQRVEQILPASVEGIKRYLGSGMIRGLGPVMAERIVNKFGEDTLHIIETQPRRLLEVLNIGPKRVEQITSAWAQQREIQNVMLFLQTHGVSTGLAVKIYKQYGADSTRIVKDDPYRLSKDIFGIGFKTADKIAQKLGLPSDSPSRIEAGIAYTLNELAGEGHVYAPQELLIKTASELLAVETSAIQKNLERLDNSELIKRETLRYETPVSSLYLPNQSDSQAVREEPAVYLAPFFYGEIGVTHRVKRLLAERNSRLADLQNQPLDWLMIFAGKQALALSTEQGKAVLSALQNKLAIITGGPGTGKTTCLRVLIQILQLRNHSFALASPTGRAAKRLSEATGQPAQTLHRLLGFHPSEGFKHNEQKPLDVDLLVVDEASMLDLLLMNNLLKAIGGSTHLLLVGDVDQLPSVGAGDVLRDLMESGVAAVNRLTTIFRQAQDSLIITNAHRINSGDLPIFPKTSKDFFLFQIEDPEEVARWIVEIVQERVPNKFGIASEQVQVLSPMYRGPAGVANLNLLLQEKLNPENPRKAERRISGTLFRVGDRVMQTRNNYDKEVYNGDIGMVARIDGESASLTVNFESRQVPYDWLEADELTHAFAISVHKAQGAEYAVVVMPVLTQHYMMLQRNLLYTAITRAKQLCVLVGTQKAIAIAVKNDKVAERYSGLQLRLLEKPL